METRERRPCLVVDGGFGVPRRLPSRAGRSSRTAEPVVEFGACGEAEAAAVLDDLDQRRAIRVFDEGDDLVEMAHDVLDMFGGTEFAGRSRFNPNDPNAPEHCPQCGVSIPLLTVRIQRDHAIEAFEIGQDEEIALAR